MNDRIETRSDFNYFLRADLKARGHIRLPFLSQLRNPITHYQYLLRRLEFVLNFQHNFVMKICCSILNLQFKRQGVRLGFQVPPYTCGPGLILVHWGSIVISAGAKIGSNCRIHSCVNIGAGANGAPVIGNDVYIGPGAKIFGAIEIGDNVIIGANAVVNRSFPANVTIAGVPAVIIKDYSQRSG